jgi:tetrahydromethanopterin S-methyltransferase subunit F
MKDLKIEFKWTLISFVFVIGWMSMERLLGLHDKNIHLHEKLTMLALIPSIYIHYLFLKDKKIHFYTHQMNFKQGLIAGLIFTVFNLILTPLFQWITCNIISPHYFQNVIQYAVSSGRVTLIEAQDYFNFNNYLIQASIATMIIGFVLSIIFAFLMRTKKIE